MLGKFEQNNKDLIILLDYSQSMGEGLRIDYAIKNLLWIFDDFIAPKDRVGFIRFNLNPKVVFSLI